MKTLTISELNTGVYQLTGSQVPQDNDFDSTVDNYLAESSSQAPILTAGQIQLLKQAGYDRILQRLTFLVSRNAISLAEQGRFLRAASLAGCFANPPTK